MLQRALVAATHEVYSWHIASNFSLAPDVSFWGEAEVGRAAEFTASVENDPEQTLDVGPHLRFGRP